MEREGMRRSFAPVRPGQELDVKIEAVGEKGDGIAKVKGFVLFVPGVKEGDEVKIKINKVFRKVGFAESIGPATGPVSVDAPRPPREESSEEEEKPRKGKSQEPEASEEEPEYSEDSEDFGEEE